MPLIMMIALAAGFWLLVMRPAKTRQQAQRNLINQLQPGQEVMTTAGLYGTVREISDTEVKLEIADGVVVRYVKEAIARAVEPAEPTATAAPAVDATETPAETDSTIVLDDQPAQTRNN